MSFFDSSVLVLDDSAAVRFFQTNQNGPVQVSIPAGETGVWTWVVSRAGFTCQTGTFDITGGGVRSAGPTPATRLQASGAMMFTGSVSANVSVTFDLTPAAERCFIDIGDDSVTGQEVLDAVETALTTQEGCQFFAASGCSEVTLANLSAGTFLFMGTGYRIRRRDPADVNATVGAFVISVDGVPVDGANGSVTFLSSSTSQDVAAAVWNYLESNSTVPDSMKDALQTSRDHGRASDAQTQPV